MRRLSSKPAGHTCYQPIESLRGYLDPTVTYSYDNGDRLQLITQGSESVDFDYDTADRLTQLTLPNGVKTGYAYNLADQVTGIAWLKADDSAIGDLGYGYDSIGRLTAQTGSYASQALPQASSGANAFDDNNRQTQHNGQALTYDANGNLTGDGTRTYVWNTRNQLTQIQQGGSAIASYQYDALGRRISKTEAGTTTGYLYDGADAVQETRGATVNPILTGLGIDQRYARNDSGGRTYFLTDHLGSTRALTDAAGNVVNRYDYTAYGQTSQTGSGFSNPYQYTGRERDATGLYYYRARYYHPGMGRFIAEDPIGLAGGLNTYGYVNGSPMMFYDPLGLWAWGDPINEDFANAVTGFGDGVSTVLSFGLYSTADFRNDWGIGGVDECSGMYRGGKYAGYAWGAATMWAAGLNGGSSSVFWSGTGNMQRAANLGRSLESTPIGSLMNRFGNKIPYGMWKVASATYAANARGVVLKVGAQSGNIWRTIEMPILNWRGIPIIVIP